MSASLLVQLSAKLGLKDETATIKKAEEFLRILQSKNVTKLNDIAKAIYCLDLATSQLGIGFDKNLAILQTGSKKNQYQNNLNTVEKVLELDKPLSISEVCVQFSCTIAKELAEKILEKYKCRGIVADFNHPQYVAAAVHTACKLKSCKVQKAQFIAISRLKSAQWKELDNEFTKFVESIGLSADTKKKKGKNDLHCYLEEYVQNIENKSLQTKKPEHVEKSIEEYEDWKNRILKESYAALADENKC